MNARDLPRTSLREAIETLAEMPAFLEAALSEGGDALASRLGEGEFSLVEHACHLRDLEREGYLVRVRRMLSEDSPTLAPFDGAAVAASRDYRSEDAHAAARAFAFARRELLGLVAPLGAAELARDGFFEGKRICLQDLVAMMVEHDRGHREEIERLIDGLEAP
jgi:hypothetical protein